MKKPKIIKSFKTYPDAKNWIESNFIRNAFDIHETNTLKSMGVARVPQGKYHVTEKKVTLKSFGKHNLHESAVTKLNKLAEKGLLIPMLKEGDVEHHMVNLGTRLMVLANINGQVVPFYHSTGAGGKKGVASGKWYPVLGIGNTSSHEKTMERQRVGAWMNKIDEKEINGYYGSPHLAGFASHLDSATGNLLKDLRKLKVHSVDEIHERTYDGFRHPQTGERATAPEIAAFNNANKTWNRFERHPEGPTKDFMADFCANINRKMGLQSVAHDPEQDNVIKITRANVQHIVSSIENSQNPNINVPDETVKLWKDWRESNLRSHAAQQQQQQPTQQQEPQGQSNPQQQQQPQEQSAAQQQPTQQQQQQQQQQEPQQQQQTTQQQEPQQKIT